MRVDQKQKGNIGETQGEAGGEWAGGVQEREDQVTIGLTTDRRATPRTGFLAQMCLRGPQYNQEKIRVLQFLEEGRSRSVLLGTSFIYPLKRVCAVQPLHSPHSERQMGWQRSGELWHLRDLQRGL